MKLTENYLKRTKQSLEETREMLFFELDYSEDLQNQTRINELKRHIVKLEKAIEAKEL